MPVVFIHGVPDTHTRTCRGHPRPRRSRARLQSLDPHRTPQGSSRGPGRTLGLRNCRQRMNSQRIAETHMHPVVLTDEDLASAEQKVLPNTPVVMLNLVAFNSSALYEDSSFSACSGTEAYFQRYAPAFRQAAAAAGVEGIKVLY